MDKIGFSAQSKQTKTALLSTFGNMTSSVEISLLQQDIWWKQLQYAMENISFAISE